MRLLILLFTISRLATCSLPPAYHGVTVGINPNSVPQHSLYHAQNKYGEYMYGYASGLSAKDEIKTADGVTRGGYSYIDANGILQTIQYVSDPVNGFRVMATNIPRDLPEVAYARAQHLAAYEYIKAEHALIAASQKHIPAVISPLPIAGGIVVPVRGAGLVATPVASHIQPVPFVPVIAPSSQYHAQDNHGQYSYGYAGPLSAKTETKTADGVTRGGYSYIDANGILQTVQYVADPINGFRVAATNLPRAPHVTLIGPKVSTIVAGPKENNVVAVAPQVLPVVTAAINPLALHPTQIDPIVVEHRPVLAQSDIVQNTNIPIINHVQHDGTTLHSNPNQQLPIIFENPGLNGPFQHAPPQSEARILTGPLHQENPGYLINQQPPVLLNTDPSVAFHQQHQSEPPHLLESGVYAAPPNQENPNLIPNSNNQPQYLPQPIPTHPTLHQILIPPQETLSPSEYPHRSDPNLHLPHGQVVLGAPATATSNQQSPEFYTDPNYSHQVDAATLHAIQTQTDAHTQSIGTNTYQQNPESYVRNYNQQPHPASLHTANPQSGLVEHSQQENLQGYLPNSEDFPTRYLVPVPGSGAFQAQVEQDLPNNQQLHHQVIQQYQQQHSLGSVDQQQHSLGSDDQQQVLNHEAIQQLQHQTSLSPNNQQILNQEAIQQYQHQNAQNHQDAIQQYQHQNSLAPNNQQALNQELIQRYQQQVPLAYQPQPYEGQIPQEAVDYSTQLNDGRQNIQNDGSKYSGQLALFVPDGAAAAQQVHQQTPVSGGGDIQTQVEQRALYIRPPEEGNHQATVASQQANADTPQETGPSGYYTTDIQY